MNRSKQGDFDPLTHIATHLTRSQVEDVRAILQKDLFPVDASSVRSMEEEDDINDLIDYTLAMITNGKTVSYIVDELKSMEMDICDAKASDQIGASIESFLKAILSGDNTSNSTAFPPLLNKAGDHDIHPSTTTLTEVQDTASDGIPPRKILSLKSNKSNALTMSGALGASREGRSQTSQIPRQVEKTPTVHGAPATASDVLSAEQKGDTNQKKDKAEKYIENNHQVSRQSMNHTKSKQSIKHDVLNTGASGQKQLTFTVDVSNVRKNHREQESGRGRGRGQGRGDHGRGQARLGASEVFKRLVGQSRNSDTEHSLNNKDLAESTANDSARRNQMNNDYTGRGPPSSHDVEDRIGRDDSRAPPSTKEFRQSNRFDDTKHPTRNREISNNNSSMRASSQGVRTDAPPGRGEGGRGFGDRDRLIASRERVMASTSSGNPTTDRAAFGGRGFGRGGRFDKSKGRGLGRGNQPSVERVKRDGMNMDHWTSEGPNKRARSAIAPILSNQHDSGRLNQNIQQGDLNSKELIPLVEKECLLEHNNHDDVVPQLDHFPVTDSVNHVNSFPHKDAGFQEHFEGEYYGQPQWYSENTYFYGYSPLQWGGRGRGGRGRGYYRGQSIKLTGRGLNQDVSQIGAHYCGDSNNVTVDESTLAAAEASPSPIVTAAFSEHFGPVEAGPGYRGRGFRGRGRGRGGPGRAEVTAILASKTWTRPKPINENPPVEDS